MLHGTVAHPSIFHGTLSNIITGPFTSNVVVCSALVYPPHMAALHHHQQRSRMLSMMQQQQQTDGSAGQSPGTPPQLSRMSMPPSFQPGASRSLFMNPADSAPSHSSDSLYYHRPPVRHVTLLILHLSCYLVSFSSSVLVCYVTVLIRLEKH